MISGFDSQLAVSMSSAVSQTLPLELLAAGEAGVVVEVDGDPGMVMRLHEMGIHAGVRVYMVRTGCPCILEINHHRFLIRCEEQATVLVDVSR